MNNTHEVSEQQKKFSEKLETFDISPAVTRYYYQINNMDRLIHKEYILANESSIFSLLNFMKDKAKE